MSTVETFEVLTMDFDKYQDLAMQTSAYPQIEGMGQSSLIYPALGLAGESGEYVDKVKKHWRNTGSSLASALTPEQRVEMAKELGDVLWYIAASAKEMGYKLSEIATMNIEKITDRRARGVVKSEGDNR